MSEEKDYMERYSQPTYESETFRKEIDILKATKSRLEQENKSLESRLKECEGLLSQETSEFKSAAFQKIKGLESRLKEVTDELTDAGEQYDLSLGEQAALRRRLLDTERARDTNAKSAELWKARFEDYKERLSQAEAERNDAWRGFDFKCEVVAKLEAKLSHLMDVVGKMAGALKKIWNQAFAGTQSVVPDEVRVIMCQEIKDGAREALASWQDFNNKQGEAK